MNFSSIHSRESWLVLWIVAVFLLKTNIASAITGPTHNKVVVCYISSWAVYRPGNGAYSLDNFDPNLCTHAVYAFAGLDITQSAIKSLDPWQDLKEGYGKGAYERLTGFKNTHPHLKVSLAIGGWNDGSRNYSILCANPLQRELFVSQVSSFIRKYGFDGLELHWKFPTQRGGEPKDRQNFVLLTKELREEFDKHNLLLTSVIDGGKYIIDEAYDIRQLSRYLDFMHILCYDYHGSWDKKVGYNSPLASFDGDVMNVQYTIEYLLSIGAPANKIVLGLPFYGRTFKTFLEGKIGDANEGTGFQGPFTREDGFMGFNEICAILSNETSGWTSSWDAHSSQAVAHSQRDDATGLIRVVTFDSTRSIANKVMYAMRKSLAGVMVWTIDTDDFLGECIPADDTFMDFKLLKGINGNMMVPQRLNTSYPLLRTINEAVTYALEEIKMEEEEKLKELNAQLLKEQVLKEQLLREQQLKEKLLKEQQLKDQQLREQQLKEYQLKDQLLKEQRLKDQLLREQQLKYQQFGEQQLKEQQLRDQQLKAQQLKERELMEQLRQLQLQLQEEELKKKEIEDQLLKQKEQHKKQKMEEELKRKKDQPIRRICYLSIPKRCFNNDFTGLEIIDRR